MVSPMFLGKIGRILKTLFLYNKQINFVIKYLTYSFFFDAEVYDLDGMEGLDMTDKNMVLPAGYKVMIRKK